MKKKTALLFFCIGFLLVSIQSQTINLLFSGQDSVIMTPVILDSVMVHNITSNCDTVIYGPSPSLDLAILTDVNENIYNDNGFINILAPWPNPSQGKTNFSVILKEPERVEMSLYDLAGKLLYKHQMNLGGGQNNFIIESSENKILLLRASIKSYSSTVKWLNISNENIKTRISYLGNSPMIFKTDSISGGFIFYLGDQLSYTTIKSGYYEESIYDSPENDTSYLFLMNPLFEGPTVVSTGISNLTPISVTVHGEVISSGGYEVTSRGFCWSENPAPTFDENYSIDGAGIGAFETNIEGLLPDVGYYCRAYAINMADTSYGEDISFSTPGDGWYIKGSSIAYSELNLNALMKITLNEVTQIEDTNLLELYIPVIAENGGFNIVEVSGTSMTTYGPGADFLTVENGDPDEPQVPFQRGSFIEDTNPFTVPNDGMYHVVIYLYTQKAVVVPVHWGMIGSATSNGWTSSVPMDESVFDLYSISWILDSLELYEGQWKYRYSDGWKVFLDTEVSVNANFGGSVESLIPGGANIVNNEPGLYLSTLEYQLGLGYEAFLTLIDTLPQTNWDGVILDAVGPGISSDNPNAVPDPSSWAWGNQLIADNGGLPSELDLVYTWTWTNVILEAYQGFKLRTLNGLPSPINNLSVDAGYLDLNIAESAPEIIDGGAPDHNLIATVNTSYTITLNIDAENDNELEIIIIMD